MARTPAPKTEGVRRERGVVPPAARSAPPPATFQPAVPGAPVSVPAVASLALPEPHAPLSDGPDLTERERVELTACETALDNLRRAFWDAGQALEVIRAGRHYKETHRSFEAYVEERWDMRRAQADRLIRAWRLGRKLDPIGSSFGARVVESQVRPLLPVAEAYGEEAATVVYTTAVETMDGKVTAGMLQGVVDVLPDEWDAEDARERVRARLRGDLAPGPGGASEARTGGENGAEAFVDAAGKAWGRLQQAVRDDVVRAAAAANPGYVRKFATDLRELADRLEREVS